MGKELKMKKPVLSVLLFAAVLLAAYPVLGGEPLVIKTAEGKFVPAAASEWVKAGEGSFRVMLKAGLKAATVVAEIKDQIAPITVEATDDLTLLFKGKDLTEDALLTKLAGIKLGEEKAKRDALAALSGLSGDKGPSLSDLDSAGSIRASKKFELPAEKKDRQVNPQNVYGKVVKVQKCEPMPTITIRVTDVPKEGEHKAAFKKGKNIVIRGFYKIHDETKKIEPEEARTKINLQSAKLKRGDMIFGKPFQKEGQVWILETIEKM
jgi:hypothetical protein